MRQIHADAVVRALSRSLLSVSVYVCVYVHVHVYVYVDCLFLYLCVCLWILPMPTCLGVHCFGEVVKFEDEVVGDDKMFKSVFERLNWQIEPFNIGMHIPQPGPHLHPHPNCSTTNIVFLLQFLNRCRSLVVRRPTDTTVG
jgi:hypothetical protein